MLSRKYGERGFRAISAVLRELAASFDGGHALMAYVDDERSLSVFGATPVSPRRPEAIRALIEQLEHNLNGGRPLAVCLVGGGDIVPFFALPNPADDPDGALLSDAPYASRADDLFHPVRAVSRLPDLAPEHAGQFVQAALSAMRASGSASVSTTGAGYTASIWREAAQEVFSLLGPPQSVRMSPPWSADDYRQLHLPWATFRYYNLHGKPDGVVWYGQKDPMLAANYADFPVALRAHDITPAHALRSIVITEACYGASLEPGSIASRFLGLGCSAFLGSSAMAYGAIAPPVTGADLLVKEFLRYMLAGLPAGQALQRARTAFSATMMAEQGFLDGEDQKTVLSFLLLGNPNARVRPTPALAREAAESQQDLSQFPVVCARSLADSRPVVLQPSLMEELEYLANSLLSSSALAGDGVRQETCSKTPIQRQVRLGAGGAQVLTFKRQLPTGAVGIAKFTVRQGRIAKAAVSR